MMINWLYTSGGMGVDEWDGKEFGKVGFWNLFFK